MNSLNQAMVRALCYADIFNYPLTLSELRRWQIKGDSQHLRGEKSSHLGGGKNGKFYHLPNRFGLVKLRRSRFHFSQLKWPIVCRAAKILSLIPSIQMVAVTGALAMNNADKNDDIDLMIITTPNSLWLTRLLSAVLLFPHLRQGSTLKHIANKLCLNLWLDETSLNLKTQSLYVAHEICQIKPLFNRNHTYQKFIAANAWYQQFLPNWTMEQGRTLTGDLAEGQVGTAKPEGPTLMDFLLDFLNSLAFHFQYFYMRRKMTRERVSSHFAFFHPRPTGDIVLQKYQQRLYHLRGERSSHLGGVVLATGCFDVLHSEHLKFLKAAKLLDGIFLIGVETNTRVRQLKGSGRPVNPLRLRLKNLQQLGVADKVFALPKQFNDLNHFTALINQIRPDILAVSFSTPHLDIKRKIMKRFGGRVVIVLPHNPKISTTILTKKLRNSII